MPTLNIILHEELEHLRSNIIANMQRNGQIASGETARSMHTEATMTDAYLYGRSPFGVLETGRRAGRVPVNFQDIILVWMQHKGIHGTRGYKTNRPHKYTNEEYSDRSLAGAIAYRIKTRGTSLHRAGGRSDVYSNEIPATIERIRKRIMSELYNETYQHIKLHKK